MRIHPRLSVLLPDFVVSVLEGIDAEGSLHKRLAIFSGYRLVLASVASAGCAASCCSAATVDLSFARKTGNDYKRPGLEIESRLGAREPRSDEQARLFALYRRFMRGPCG